jgi:hypothetical protein
MSQEWMAMLTGIAFASFLGIPGLIGVYLQKRERKARRSTPPSHP